jgi:hypothetical protein
VTIRVTDHAVEQYQARVKPALDFDQARREVLALVLGAEIQAEPPPWLWPDPSNKPEGYIVVADGICFPVAKRGTIVTCLANCNRSEPRRAARKARKLEKRAKKRWQNDLGKPGGHKRGGRFTWA